MENPNPQDESPGAEQGASALRTFVGLFLVPLVVVVVCVGVFVGFGWVAYDKNSTGDYLNDLRSSWRPRRAQAAYELSKILVADPTALDDEPELRREVGRLFQESEDAEMRRYLALVLGHTGDPEAVPLLVEALEDPDSELSIYSLWALGELGDPAAAPAVTAAIADEDPGIRKTAAFALGELELDGAARDEAVATLLPLTEDTVADVRWNAALSLSRLGSDAGVPELGRMVDRNLVMQVPGITPSQAEEAMLGAIAALAAVGSDEDLEALREVARNDPSLKVRQAALQALER